MDVIIPVLERHLGYPLGKVTEMRGDWEWQMSGCSLRRGRGSMFASSARLSRKVRKTTCTATMIRQPAIGFGKELLWISSLLVV